MRRSRDVEGERGRGRCAARVVVAAARHDHLHALGRRLPARREHLLPVVQPGRARDRARRRRAARSTLRCAPGRRLTSSPSSCTRGACPQFPAQHRGVAADGERAGQRAVGNARRAGLVSAALQRTSALSIGATIDGHAAPRADAAGLTRVQAQRWQARPSAQAPLGRRGGGRRHRHGARARRGAARAEPCAGRGRARREGAPRARRPRREHRHARPRPARSRRGRRAPAGAVAPLAVLRAADPRRARSARSSASPTGAPSTLFASLGAVVLGTLEFTIREHRTGYRSHAALLAAVPTALAARRRRARPLRARRAAARCS